MREFVDNADSFDIAGKYVGVLVLEFDGHLIRSIHCETHDFIKVLNHKREDIRDKQIQHGNLASVSLIFLDHEGNLTIPAKSFDGAVVFSKLDQRLLCVRLTGLRLSLLQRHSFFAVVQ